jgi:hypothetical protein
VPLCDLAGLNGMTAPFIKLLKVWLILLTAWLGLITILIAILGSQMAGLSLHDPKAMTTEWAGNSLSISCGQSGPFFITHLKDVNRYSFAELPKPLLVATSGGLLIPYSDLTNLVWIVPVDVHQSAFPISTNQVVAPPAVGTPLEAVYLFPATAKSRFK